MAQTQQVGSLQVGQDLEFQRREWKIQRAAWVVVLLILLAGFIGLLGAGPLSHAETSSERLTLQYQRLARNFAPASLQLRVAPGATVDGEIPIWLNRAFLDKVNIERIVPEPVEMKTAPDRVFYHFSVANPDQPAEITFHLEPAEPGLAQGQLGIVDAETISFDQFIFP